jgi:hypothetical protein
MAGLIEQEMSGAPGAPAPEQEQMPGGMPMGEQEEGEVDEDNPALQDALQFAYEILYGQDAAKDISKQLKSASSVSDGMADIAYNITSIVDEKTNGSVPDELLVPMAMDVLEEVAEIADASGLNPAPEDIAGAFKTMILRYLGEQGVDTTQLQQAMDQVDASEFSKVAEQAA